jgi:predicted 3-demethylubiquinone-9 3-methyltransferase (glyoxalase superfamily)
MQKITPNIWFNHNAKEAAEFYVKAFPGGKIVATSHYPTEDLADFQKEFAGKELTVDFELGGHRFTAINAGPEFSVNPSVSFLVNFDPSRDEKAKEHLDELWQALVEGGKELMPLGEYPYSKHYGWVQDRYGVTWQLMLTDPESEPRPFIIPSLMFSGQVVNKAEEAVKYYLSVFKDARKGTEARYSEDTGPAKAGSLMFADFMLENQWFAAMDSGVEHDFTFNEGVSLLVNCKDQAEIDYYWEKLSAVPESEQCGWCKDKFGVSWQIGPADMESLMSKPGSFAKLMEMKKIVIADF